jgi:hypothetical protein
MCNGWVALRHNPHQQETIMTEARGSGWFFIGLGLLIAAFNLLDIRDLWARFNAFDWIMIILLMIGPPVVLWRYLKVAEGTAEQVGRTGISIALGGYVPLWFSFMLAERVANG